MPNMEDLINRISTEISKNDEEELWITKVDLDYCLRSNGIRRRNQETLRICTNRWQSTRNFTDS